MQDVVSQSGHRASTERRVRAQVDKIVEEFGPRPIVSIRPSEVREWTARLRENYAQRTVSSFYGRWCKCSPTQPMTG